MEYLDFERILSAKRMQRYKDAANGDTRKAMALYRYNLRLSQEMFTIVSCFEVALRNAIDSLLVPSLGGNWLKDSVQDNGIFSNGRMNETRKIIEKAYNRLNRQGIYSHSKLIAEMEFGVWKYMYSSLQYRATGQCLLRAFPNKPRSSAAVQYNNAYIFNELDKVNSLRNRIAHHEPICFRLHASEIDTSYIVNEYQKSEVANYESSYAGRITKGAAIAMQTRIYLYEKKYDEVKKAFEKFQNECGGEYSLVAPEDYAWQFSLDGEHCSSSILEVNMYVSSTQSSYNVNNGNRHVLMSMPRNMTIGFGCAQPTQALADAYDAEGDVIRKKTTLLSTEEAIEIETAAKGDVAPVTDDRTGWYNRKLYLAPGQREENRGNNQPTNLRLIRLAEVYLNYAEACYFSGDIANAQKYLNEVRSHVNLAPKNHTGSQLFEDIMNERHLEFGMEGFRFFDVVRVGWGEKVFNGTKKAEFGAKTPFSAGAEVLPIPQTEIDISDGLITN